MTAGSRHPVGLTPSSMTCRQLRVSGPEIALGISSPQERSAALDHMRQCVCCRQELAEWSRVADVLIGLLPPAEPPFGLAERVIAGVGPPSISAKNSDRVRTGPQGRCSSGGRT